MSPASENLNDIGGDAVANADVWELLVHSWACRGDRNISSHVFAAQTSEIRHSPRNTTLAQDCSFQYPRLSDANINKFLPFPSLPLTSAPPATRNSTISRCPFVKAKIGAVLPSASFALPRTISA